MEIISNENELLKSKKINLDKKFMLGWIILAAIIAVILILSSIGFSSYKEGQDATIDLFINSRYSQVRGHYEAAENHEDLVSRVHNSLSPSWTSSSNELVSHIMSINAERLDILYYELSDNWLAPYSSNLKNAASRLSKEVLKTLESKGYDCHDDAAYYVKHANYLDFAFTNYKSLVIPVILAAILLGLTNVLYLKDKATEIAISEGVITYKASKGKSKKFLVKDIGSVETTGLKGLKITGVGVNAKIILIENAENIKTQLMNMRSSMPNESTPVITTENNADSIKKYKELLDSGIITQEEFDAKKKQLLDL